MPFLSPNLTVSKYWRKQKGLDSVRKKFPVSLRSSSDSAFLTSSNWCQNHSIQTCTDHTQLRQGTVIKPCTETWPEIVTCSSSVYTEWTSAFDSEHSTTKSWHTLTISLMEMLTRTYDSFSNYLPIICSLPVASLSLSLTDSRLAFSESLQTVSGCRSRISENSFSKF